VAPKQSRAGQLEFTAGFSMDILFEQQEQPFARGNVLRQQFPFSGSFKNSL
jgi:hypothetical protein